VKQIELRSAPPSAELSGPELDADAGERAEKIIANVERWRWTLKVLKTAAGAKGPALQITERL
jgi:hypothetical protein